MLNTDTSYRSLMKKIGLQFFAEGDDKGTDQNEDKSGEDKGTETKTFTQAEINRMMTAEKNQGRMAILKELGLEGDAKDAKKLIDAYKADQEAKKTETQKKDDAIKDLTEKEKAAVEKAAKIEAKFTAVEAGVNMEFLDDVLAIATIKVTETKDLKTVIEEMKTKYPSFFTKTETKEEKGTGGSVGGGKKTEDKETESLGERLGKKNAVQTKSAYWSH